MLSLNQFYIQPVREFQPSARLTTPYEQANNVTHLKCSPHATKRNMAKKSYLVGFFVFLAILILLVPVLICVRRLSRGKQQRELFRDLEARPETQEWQPLSSPRTAEMLRTGRRDIRTLEAPENAKIHESISGRLNSTMKPSHSRPGLNPYAATVSDVDDIPDTTAAAMTANGPDIGRSLTQKTYSTMASRASTIVDGRMRAESIATAHASPLPKILPGSDGYFRAPPERPSLDSSRSGSYRTTVTDRSAASASKTKKLTSDYKLEREKLRRKEEGKVTGHLQKPNENVFDEVDLGEPSTHRKQGVQSKDFAKVSR